jgi:guanylate kinase
MGIESNLEKQPGAGEKLFSQLSQLELPTLRLRKENLEKLNNIDSVIIVGSSWSGKTTIRNVLAEAVSANPVPSFDFPKRVITRAQRPNDNLEENEFASDLEELKMKVAGGIIWKRNLGERIEYYGFKMPHENCLPIYSANNTLIRERDSLIQNPNQHGMQNSLVLLIYAPDDERAERNVKREGDYLEDKPEQKKIRASDRAISMYPEAHILVNNSDSTESAEQKHDLCELLNVLDSLSK